MDALKKHKDHVDRHAEALARDAASMDVNARAGLDLAEAYLDIGKSAMVAEARLSPEGATDATRKGIDVEAQTRRQLAIMLADGAVQAGQVDCAAACRDGCASELNDQVAAGAIGADELSTTS
jgi:hypothetical protein